MLHTAHQSCSVNVVVRDEDTKNQAAQVRQLIETASLSVVPASQDVMVPVGPEQMTNVDHEMQYTCCHGVDACCSSKKHHHHHPTLHQDQ
jgi:hypothetical protein